MNDDTAYPPGSWTVDGVRAALSEPDGSADLPTVADRDEWAVAASDPTTSALAASIRDLADEHSGEPVAALPASAYADYVRTGDRNRYERAYFGRRQRLSTLALAECLDGDGAYVDDVLDRAWAVCEETTWLLPAHLPDDERRDGLPAPADPDDHCVALFSARTAHLLGELDHLLGDRLNAGLGARIRSEVDERVLRPFEARDDFDWQRPDASNWNAVCHASSALAALYLEPDRDRVARIVAKAVHGLENYLDGFSADGCTAEGLSYWNFGLGHYAMLAAALAARSDGRLSLFSPPVLREAARFPLRIRLGPGKHVPFSDARETTDVDPYLACRLGDEFEMPGLAAAGRRSLAAADGPYEQRRSDQLMEVVRDLLWCRGSAVGEADGPGASDGIAGADTTPPRRFFSEDLQWWFARADPTDPDGLVVAAKGGHNGEHHNHNDCGSFVVHYRGESPVTDLGFGTYDRDYFGDRRYEYLVARSLGHSVPYVAGREQAAGQEYAAEIVDAEATAERDRVVLELAGCYPDDAGLASLRRSIELDRSGRRVTVDDAATFEDGAADPSFESVFVSYLPIERSGDGLVVEGERTRTRIEFEAEPERVAVEHLDGAIDLSSAYDFDVDARDVWRARVAPGRADGDRASGESASRTGASRETRSVRTTVTPRERPDPSG